MLDNPNLRVLADERPPNLCASGNTAEIDPEAEDYNDISCE